MDEDELENEGFGGKKMEFKLSKNVQTQPNSKNVDEEKKIR